MVLDRRDSPGSAGIYATRTEQQPTKMVVRDNIVRNWSDKNGVAIKDSGGAAGWQWSNNREITDGPTVDELVGELGYTDTEHFIREARTRGLGEWDPFNTAKYISDAMWEELK